MQVAFQQIDASFWSSFDVKPLIWPQYERRFGITVVNANQMQSMKSTINFSATYSVAYSLRQYLERGGQATSTSAPKSGPKPDGNPSGGGPGSSPKPDGNPSGGTISLALPELLDIVNESHDYAVQKKALSELIDQSVRAQSITENTTSDFPSSEVRGAVLSSVLDYVRTCNELSEAHQDGKTHRFPPLFVNY